MWGESGPIIALLGGVLGALGGYLLSNLVWWALPALPAVVGVLAYLYGEDAALPPAYLVGLPFLAALISLGVLRAVRRL